MAEFNPNKIIAEIVETVKETHEAFIFETVRPYCEEVIQQKLDKQTLNDALLMYKNRERYNKEIISETVRTIEELITNCGSYELNPEITDYDRGLRDAFETVLEILNNYEEYINGKEE